VHAHSVTYFFVATTASKLSQRTSRCFGGCVVVVVCCGGDNDNSSSSEICMHSVWFERSRHVAPLDCYFRNSVAKGLACVLLMRHGKKTTTPVRLSKDLLTCACLKNSNGSYIGKNWLSRRMFHKP